MESFLELLESVCGQDHEVLIRCRGKDFSFLLVVQVIGFRYDEEERVLNLKIDTIDYGSLMFGRITHVEHLTGEEEEPEYRIYYGGGVAEMTFNLF